ncbi:cell division protein ZapA [uncultured Sphingomonas sp.]|uniref:cell division protein ZapA n=1 Tax=uncultured Sphingomonas sp. TaxID=158754 RepID=UPI0025D05BB9|nr:cell division protein ZapA [uncultured Sphingomonas sp.]
MAEVTIMVGDRPHRVACQDGGEARVRMLGQMLDQRWPAALRASGGHNGERALLFVALLLADALEEAERRPPAGAAVSEAALARIAEQLEALADALEPDGRGDAIE